MSAGFNPPARPRVLVINMRRIGDVLLTTPLFRTLRKAYPEAKLHALVFTGTEGVLAGNPDIDGVIAMPSRPSVAETIATLRKIWRCYDLVIATQSGDRPAFLALAAGRYRIGLVPQSGLGATWKTWVYHQAVTVRPHEHRVAEILRLVEELGIAPQTSVVPPSGAPASASVPRKRYAVIHAAPMFAYRRWTRDGWRALAWSLSERGLDLVASGGPDPTERAYLDQVWGEGAPAVERLDGRLNWPQLAALLAGASVYVGPDTSVTHLAAAAGCPTVALFGPTDPRLWGPWPAGGLAGMWQADGGTQRRGNVWLVQHTLPCTPCQEEGCERHRGSFSACLDELSAGQVLAAVDEALASSEVASPVGIG